MISVIKQVSIILIPWICEILSSISGLNSSIDGMSTFNKSPQSPDNRQILSISSTLDSSFRIRLISLKSGTIFTVALIFCIVSILYSIVKR